MIFEATKKAVPSKVAPSLGLENGSTPLTATNAKAVVRPGDAQQSRMAQTFAQIVAVLMRDTGYRNLRLSDLEWLVLPPVIAGQFRLAHATTQPAKKQLDAVGKAPLGGTFVPVAVAVWARVSPEIEKALSGNLDKQVRLRPSDWASGDNMWLMAAAGHPRAVPEFLKQLQENEFKGKQVKMRLRGPDGKVIIKTVEQSIGIQGRV